MLIQVLTSLEYAISKYVDKDNMFETKVTQNKNIIIRHKKWNAP